MIDLKLDILIVGSSGGYYHRETAPKDTQTVNILPIAVPAIPVDELKDLTDNFGTKSLIGEGSYGRVYHGVLKSGPAAAIKKLDSSKQPDQEFLSQVRSTGTFFIWYLTWYAILCSNMLGS